MDQPAKMAPEQVLGFWFVESAKEKWYVKDPAFDHLCLAELGNAHRAATDGLLDDWQETARGALALVILLDQMPRHYYRGDARAFACDAKARSVTRRAIERGLDQALLQEQRYFLYLPLEHSENFEDQETCVRLVEALDEDPEWLRYSIAHRDIIARFGRFPHRNAALGRVSTAEEEEFLKQPGSSF